jgi:hypothetical protein
VRGLQQQAKALPDVERMERVVTTFGQFEFEVCS